jgi:hypothetical protein
MQRRTDRRVSVRTSRPLGRWSRQVRTTTGTEMGLLKSEREKRGWNGPHIPADVKN